MGKDIAPGPQERRFAAYIEGLAEAAGHADRNVPLKNYCTALLLPGERKSVEPMAARLAPENLQRMHQSLHHVVADAPWNDEAVLDRCLDFVLPTMLRHEPVVAWVVDDTGFPKKGQESVGVARQYCGQVGKQDNCRVAVSLSVTTETASMPIAFRLYLPEAWVKDRKRRKKTGVPDQIEFQTKAEIALEQIQRARERRIPKGVVLADAGYGNDTSLRTALTEMKLTYVMGVQSTVTVWKPGEEPKPAPARQGSTGRPRKLLQRDSKHQPVSAKELATSLPAEAWHRVTWRQGVKKKLQSRFAALRVRPAHRDYWRAEPHPEEWLLIEWPSDETHQILAVHHVCRHSSGRIGAHGQTPVDHRAGLSGTEAGTRPGPLRRTGMAGVSPSRHLMYSGLWIPGGRTESFFPLSPGRQSWATSPRTADGLPAARLAACVPSGIIRVRLLLSASSLPVTCWGGWLTARSAGHRPADPPHRYRPPSRNWPAANGSARISKDHPTVPPI